MSKKLKSLFSHLKSFAESLENMSKKQGERLHQDINLMEERYQGRWDTHMMIDYCGT